MGRSFREIRAAALVVVFSALLIIVGISFMDLQLAPTRVHPGPDAAMGMFPPAAVFAGATVLTGYGTLGLALGLWTLTTGGGDYRVTFAKLVIETIGGWFFFIVGVPAQYAYMIHFTPTAMPGLTITQSKALIAMAMLDTAGNGIPLLGASFYFTLQLAQYQRGQGLQKYSSMASLARTYFYLTLMLIKGVAEIAGGAIINAHISSHKLPMTVAVAPLAITWAPMTIADGTQVTVLALIGFVIAIARIRSLYVPFAILSLLSFVVQMALYAVAPVGYYAMNPIILGPIIASITIAMNTMPAYLLLESNTAADAEGEIEAAKDLA